jgi:hypothetical protein
MDPDIFWIFFAKKSSFVFALWAVVVFYFRSPESALQAGGIHGNNLKQKK